MRRPEGHVWAERYDRAVDHVFAVQDEIAEAVATAIRDRQSGMPNGGASCARPIVYWVHRRFIAEGLWHLSQGTRTENGRARLLFRQATRLIQGLTGGMYASRLVRTYRNDAIPYGIP